MSCEAVFLFGRLCRYGPDCTQRFLSESGLRLVVRSHEGPDAREKRTDMLPMSVGFTVDHSVDAGLLVTLFSAPDYPQFQATFPLSEHIIDAMGVVWS